MLCNQAVIAAGLHLQKRTLLWQGAGVCTSWQGDACVCVNLVAEGHRSAGPPAKAGVSHEPRMTLGLSASRALV